MNIETIRKLQERVRRREEVSEAELTEALAFLREDRTLKPKATKTAKAKAARPKVSLDELMGDLLS